MHQSHYVEATLTALDDCCLQYDLVGDLKNDPLKHTRVLFFLQDAGKCMKENEINLLVLERVGVYERHNGKKNLTHLNRL